MNHHAPSFINYQPLFYHTSYLLHLKFLLVAVPVQLLRLRGPYTGPWPRPRGARFGHGGKGWPRPCPVSGASTRLRSQVARFFGRWRGGPRLGGWKGSMINALSQYIYIYYIYWLVVSNICYFPWYMGCHPSHWLSYFSRWLKHVKTTNQCNINWYVARWFMAPMSCPRWSGKARCQEQRALCRGVTDGRPVISDLFCRTIMCFT